MKAAAGAVAAASMCCTTGREGPDVVRSDAVPVNGDAGRGVSEVGMQLAQQTLSVSLTLPLIH